MATKKKTEDVEVVEEVTSEAKTTKKSTTKKSTSTKKKAEKVEEPKVEEVKEPEPVIEEPVKEEKKVEEVKVAEPVEVKTEEVKESEVISATYKINSGIGLYTFTGPGLDNPKAKPLGRGAVVIVSETKGNWGKIGENRWVLMGPNLVKM